MAKSSSQPDCVHCRFVERHANGEYRCRQYNIVLHTPVSLFCKMIEPASKRDSDYTAWFYQRLDFDALEKNILYTWVETLIYNQQGENTIQVDAETVAPVTAFTAWSAGAFWKVLRSVRKARREHYRQHGYTVDTGT